MLPSGTLQGSDGASAGYGTEPQGTSFRSTLPLYQLKKGTL